MIFLHQSILRSFSISHEHIDPAFTSVTYCTFDDAINRVRTNGPTAVMAKIDIKHAVRLCPVHQTVWHLLGFRWDGSYYYDYHSVLVLRLYLSSATWLHTYVIHYLDDFFLCQNNTEDCQRVCDTILSLFKDLAIPVASGDSDDLTSSSNNPH